MTVNSKKVIKRCLAVIGIWLIVFLVSAIPVTKRNIESLNDYQINPSNLVKFGYITEDDVFIPTNIDPQLHFSAVTHQINDVEVKLAKPLQKDTLCQLFFASNGEGFSEANSVKKLFKEGSTEIYFSIPTAVYSYLRVDIDASFKLDSIILSELSYSSSFLSFKLDVPLFIILSLIAMAVLVFYIKYEKRVNSRVLTIRQNLFSNSLDENYIKSNATKMANTYTFIALISGIVLVFFIPPLVVADEHTHFFKVLMVSHFEFIPEVNGEFSGAIITSAEADFLNSYVDVFHTQLSFSDFFKTPYNYYSTEFFASSHAYLNFFGYLIPGVAVAIARNIFENYNVYALLIVARLANLFVGILMVRHALKVTPAFRNTMFLLALMPMTIHQCSSASYDALLICSSFLLFAYLMKLLLSDKDYRITAKDIVIICLCFSVIFAAKAVYALVALIFLAVSYKKFGSLKKYISCIALIGLSAVVFFFLPQYLNSLAPSLGAVATASDSSVFNLTLSDISNVVSNTINYHSDGWRNQFFGVLGSLQVHLPKISIELFYIVLIVTVIFDACQIKGLNILSRVLSYICFLAVTVIIIVNAYLNWTWSPDLILRPIADGIQGRYFIPIIMFPLMIFANPLLTRFKYREKLTDVSCRVVSVTGILCCALTVFAIIAFYGFK